MKAFEIDTLDDQGGLGDVARIHTLLAEMFPDEDEEALCRQIARLDAEIEAVFDRYNVRAAARALAEILTHTNEIDGSQAEIIIDHHLTSGTENARAR